MYNIHILYNYTTLRYVYMYHICIQLYYMYAYVRMWFYLKGLSEIRTVVYAYYTVPLKGNVALARHSMLEARKLDTLYSC